MAADEIIGNRAQEYVGRELPDVLRPAATQELTVQAELDRLAAWRAAIEDNLRNGVYSRPGSWVTELKRATLEWRELQAALSG